MYHKNQTKSVLTVGAQIQLLNCGAIDTNVTILLLD